MPEFGNLQFFDWLSAGRAVPVRPQIRAALCLGHVGSFRRFRSIVLRSLSVSIQPHYALRPNRGRPCGLVDGHNGARFISHPGTAVCFCGWRGHRRRDDLRTRAYPFMEIIWRELRRCARLLGTDRACRVPGLTTPGQVARVAYLGHERQQRIDSGI